MNKKEYIKKLPKVKIVLGNGFDLHCGLHTTYSDYYCKNYRKYLFIQNLYSNYEKTDILVFDFDDERVKQLNVWDIFFALNSSCNPKQCSKRWCDIERMIQSSLVSLENEQLKIDEISIALVSKINWLSIKDCVVNERVATNHRDRFVVSYCLQKMDINGLYPHKFFEFLLEELKAFEKNFGAFVYYQIHDSWYERCNSGSIFLNTSYIDMAIDTLNELCDENNLVGIDSFNFSYIHTNKMLKLIQHINGSSKNPIFGIDSIFEPKDDAFLFTKTSRRLDFDLVSAMHDPKPEFENLIIYGHSLNEADYSYFFPIFDKLKLTDFLSNSVIVFAYSIYDKQKELEIKSDLRQAISNIVSAYAKSKNLSDPNRFLDSLTIQKKILTYEIPELDRRVYSRSFLEQEWTKIYQEIESLNADITINKTKGDDK